MYITACCNDCYAWSVFEDIPVFCVLSGGMGGSSRIIPIDQFSKANQRLNKQHAGQGGGHHGNGPQTQ